MKYALVRDSRVHQIEPVPKGGGEPFPVHEDFSWVKCDDDVTTWHTYEDGKFTTPPPPPEAPTAEQTLSKIRAFLDANPDARDMLLNATDSSP